MHVVVTGTSRGIGAGLVQHYRGQGDRVTATSRFERKGIISAGISNPQALFDVAATSGPIDLLVCNAAVYFDKNHTLPDGFDANLWGPTFSINVTGTFLAIQAFLPNLIEAKGKIAIISSKMGSSELASGGAYIYRASKAAVLNLGRNLAYDLRSDEVPVGIYHPGWVKTDMGGSEADITVEESVAGLTSEFAALSMETTGCFHSYDGTKIPF